MNWAAAILDSADDTLSTLLGQIRVNLSHPQSLSSLGSGTPGLGREDWIASYSWPTLLLFSHLHTSLGQNAAHCKGHAFAAMNLGTRTISQGQKHTIKNLTKAPALRVFCVESCTGQAWRRFASSQKCTLLPQRWRKGHYRPNQGNRSPAQGLHVSLSALLPNRTWSDRIERSLHLCTHGTVTGAQTPHSPWILWL